MALLLAIATAELLTAQSPRPSAPNGWSATTPPAHDTASIPDRGVTRVELRLARGSLIVRGTDRSDIELRTTRRSTSEDPRAVVMRTSQGNDGVVRVVAVYPSPWLHPARECLLQDEELGDFWHHDITVDVELSIPAHIDLWLRTMRGDAEISDLAGTLDVATNDGDLRLRRLKGGVKAAALGEIHLEWDSFSVSAAHTRRLSAYGGAVRLWIPHGESLRIDDGRVLVAGDREIEVARTEDAQGLSLSMAMGGMGAPIEVDLTRSRLILMPPSRSTSENPARRSDMNDATTPTARGTSVRRADAFFYGLFMDEELLRAKGLEPEGAEHAAVDGLALRIGQRAALVPQPGGRVHGLVFSLTLSELDRLYSEPSVQAYRPQAVLAQLARGGVIAALCYNLPQPPSPTERNPEYAAKLRALAQKIGLPAEYVASLR